MACIWLGKSSHQNCWNKLKASENLIPVHESSTLKPNIVNAGMDCPVSYTVEDIAKANVFVLEQSFPVAMKGANYLSGGQDLITAASRLSAINKANTRGPWNLRYGLSLLHFQVSIELPYSPFECCIFCSFSWSQALQLPLLNLCKGKGELQLEEMGKLYIEELITASAASKGQYQWKRGEGDHIGVIKDAALPPMSA